MATANPGSLSTQPSSISQDEEWRLRNFQIVTTKVPESIRQYVDQLVNKYGGGLSLEDLLKVNKKTLWQATGLSAGQKQDLLGPKGSPGIGTADLSQMDSTLSVWILRNLFEVNIFTANGIPQGAKGVWDKNPELTRLTNPTEVDYVACLKYHRNCIAHQSVSDLKAEMPFPDRWDEIVRAICGICDDPTQMKLDCDHMKIAILSAMDITFLQRDLLQFSKKQNQLENDVLQLDAVLKTQTVLLQSQEHKHYMLDKKVEVYSSNQKQKVKALQERVDTLEGDHEKMEKVELQQHVQEEKQNVLEQRLDNSLQNQVDIKDTLEKSLLDEKAIREEEHTVIIKRVETLEKTESLPDLRSIGKRIKKELKKKYKKDRHMPLLPWNPASYSDIKNASMNLKIKEMEGKEPIFTTYMDMLRDARQKGLHRIVVSGKAGVGKSTFSQRIANDWANGDKILNKMFDYLIVMKLKYLREGSPEAGESCRPLDIICSQLFSDTCITADDISSLYSRLNRQNTLVILDGFDELGGDVPNFISKMLKDQLLPYTTLIVLTRPCQKAALATRYLSVDLCGFELDEATEYMERVLENELKHDSAEARKLVIKIHRHSSNASIEELITIPLFAAFVSILLSAVGYLPSSRTDLFKELVENMLIRCHYSNQDIDEEDVVKVWELVKPDLLKAGKLALAAIIEDKLVLKLSDLNDIPESLFHIGLLYKLPIMRSKVSKFKPPQMVEFLHKTMQEYCAAFYVTEILSSTSTSVTEKDLIIRSLRQIGQRILQYDHFAVFATTLKPELAREVMACLFPSAFQSYEPDTADNPYAELEREIHKNLKELDQNVWASVPHYSVTVLGGKLSLSEKSPEDLMQLVPSIHALEATFYCSVVQDIFGPMANPVIPSLSLTILILEAYNDSLKFIHEQPQLLAKVLEKSKNLKFFSICGDTTNFMSADNKSATFKPTLVALSGCSQLTFLKISHCNLSGLDVEIVGLKACNKIKSLSVLMCDLHSKDAEALGHVLTCFPHLTSFDVCANWNMEPGAKHMIASLSACRQLRSIGLQDCRMSSETASELANIVTVLPYLESLNLRENPNRNEELQKLIKNLQQCSIRHINIGMCELNPLTVKALADAMPLLSTLASIEIYQNPNIAEAVPGLINNLHHCPVTGLHLFGCGLTSSTILAMAAAIARSPAPKAMCFIAFDPDAEISGSSMEALVTAIVQARKRLSEMGQYYYLSLNSAFVSSPEVEVAIERLHTEMVRISMAEMT